MTPEQVELWRRMKRQADAQVAVSAVLLTLSLLTLWLML